ncbi:MAG: hypothetical protein AB3N09_07195 [Tateyamaria sp.]
MRRPLFRWIRLGLFTNLLFLAGALAADPLRPTEPSRSDIPKLNFLGERVSGLILPAAAALRFDDGRIIAMLGYIIGQRNGTSNFVYWNQLERMECYGKTVPTDGNVGSGQFVCAEAGQEFMRGPFLVRPEKYKKREGDVKATFEMDDGSQVSVNLAWQRRRFPALERVLDGL